MDDIRINGLTADEWEQLANPQPTTNEDLTNMGVLQENQQPQQAEPQPNTNPEIAKREDYENLGYWETVGDEFTAAGVELSKFFVPKKYELDYTPRTKAGETYQTFVKYLYGVGGLAIGGEVAGLAKGALMAKNAVGAAKVAGVAEAVMKGNKFFKTGSANLLKKFGVGVLNVGTQGVLQGAILDATIHEEDEGRFADMLGDTNVAFVDWLQTDPNDSTAEAKLKNVVDGALFSIGINGVFSAAEPILGRVLKNAKAIKAAKDEGKEIPTATAEEVVKDNQKLEKIANTADLVDTVKSIKQEADELGEDASQMVADRLNPEDIENGQNILKTLNEGEDIFVHDDGTWDIRVTNWEDAYKVSPEEYQKQLTAMDEINGESNVGNTALNYQDQAVKSTWVNRGWIGEAEDLTQANANKIAKNYTDKWQVVNNVKVEFVDGLKINGKAVEGNTSKTTFLGKNKKPTKAQQTKIDKKKLEIQQLKDKITMEAGTNDAVSDPLDVLKEKLRIAQEELKNLEKIPQPEKVANIIIKIDKNAKNPYATLRSELEHARDIAKGEVPNQEVQHFSRYTGMNEGEVAAGYTYKKSVGRNKALNPENQGVENISKDMSEGSTKAVNESEGINTPKDNSTSLKTDSDMSKNAETQQLTIDFSKSVNTEDVVNTTISQGAKTVDDITAMVNKTIEVTPEISGTTWEAIAKDSDKYADFLIECENQGMLSELEAAFNINDVKVMDAITRKVMAVQKLCADLSEKLTLLGKNPTLDQKANIIDLISQVQLYTKGTGSASGRNLQARKLINKAVQTFGSLRTSELTKAGIKDLSDLLLADIKNELDLNFTRGEKLTPAEMKANLMAKWLQNTESPFVQMILNDETIATKVNEIIEKAIKHNADINLEQEILKAIKEVDYDTVFNAIRLTDDPKTKANVIKNWTDKNGSLTAYYVHNLLSGVGTLAKNIISGGINTVYFPAKKIIAGYLGGGEALTREGWNTYLNMKASWSEAWSLCQQAFLKGDSSLQMAKSLEDTEVNNGLREWSFDFNTPEGIWAAAQNFHSFMTRAMGASDVFMTQLNYRSIMRAKALEKANQLAVKFGITDDLEIAQIADRCFKDGLDSQGRPLNIEALAEAKDILYQLPLNGQMLDSTTGEMIQVRNTSWATDAASGLNSMAAKNPLIKIIFPFVKTGANILQQNLEHNGIYALLSTNQRQLLMSQTREGALARSQVAFGMFSFMVGTSMAIGGMVTGSAPLDPDERKALFATGWKPYSIKFGDKYYSYQGYEPIQTILGFAADSVNIGANIVTSKDEEKWQRFTQQILSLAVNNFLDKAAFRSGINQLAFLASPDANYADFQKALTQTAQGFLPMSSMVRNLSSLGDRDITTPTSYERIFSNYFNRGLGDYRRDVFGNRQDNVGLLLTNAASNNTYLPEYEELKKLANYGFNPSEITKTVTDTTLQYKQFKDPATDRSMYDAMQEELSTMTLNGKTLQEAVRELVTSQEYKDKTLGVNMNGIKYSTSDDTQLNAIRAIFVEYNNAAMQKVIQEQGDVYVDNKKRTLQEAVDVVNLEKARISTEENLDSDVTNMITQWN